MTLDIAHDFAEFTEDDWLLEVEKTLRGAATETLISHEYDGLQRQPLYTQNTIDTNHDPAGFPGAAPYWRGAQALPNRHLPWQICQRVIASRKGHKNQDILTNLQGGVSALLLDCRFGVNNLSALLAGVEADYITLALDNPTLADIETMQNWYGKTSGAVYLNYDPFSLSQTHHGIEALCKTQNPALVAGMVAASGVYFHNQGASDTQELGFALASFMAYARAFEAAGMDAQTACQNIIIKLTASTDFFMTIAKIRAARALITQIAQGAGISIIPQIHTETSQAQHSTLDPWVNILRATIATFAAGLGGADLITTACCTALGDGDNELTQRIARNTQIILQSESHIGHVVDPAGGSWYIEKLSQELAAGAWQLFQEIEAEGGILAAHEKGIMSAHIAKTQAMAQKATETRSAALLGVSEFPNLEEAPLPLPPQNHIPNRPAQAYETLRYAAQAVKPKVFLATIGTQAEYTARANFATNIYAAGGFIAVSSDERIDTNQLAPAFLDSGAKIAVICGTDKGYETNAAAYAKILTEAGAQHIAVAGKFTAAMIDDQIFMGCNALSFLQKIHKITGLDDTDRGKKA